MARKQKAANEYSKKTPENGKDLYKLLGVDDDASQDVIRRAYHKRALLLHPDKNPGDETAKAKFQSLQSVIEVLGDPAKRKLYDETGSVEDVELIGDLFDNFDKFKFLRAVFMQVTEKELERFAKSHRGSKMEKKELKEMYTQCRGDMTKVFDRLVCPNSKSDSLRFMIIIDAAISAGEVDDFEIYRKWAAGVDREEDPAAPLKRKKRKIVPSSKSQQTCRKNPKE